MSTGSIWRGILPAMAIGLSLIATGYVQAAPGSATCRSIEAQLARGGGASVNRRFSAAADKQRREIGIIRGQMAAAGCGFFNSSPRCSSLSRTASRMNANLAQLNAKAGGGSGRSRAQLLAALNANECRSARKPPARESSQGLMARLFGQPAPERRARDRLAYWNDAPSDGARIIKRKTGGRDRIARTGRIPTGFGSGTMRTFCVRTCDGYYFPMSPASTRDDMARDEQNCQAACPGAETKLYFHADGQEDAEAMMSHADGKPYEKLKTAFAYREAGTLKTPQCSCSVQPGALKIVSKDAEATAGGRSVVPLPGNRPDPAADPETHANRDGDLDNAAATSLLSKNGDEMELAHRAVRVVGPVFLPDPAAAKAQPAPGQTGVQ